VKAIQNGAPVAPFAARTLPPIPLDFGRRENLVRRSREKYAADRAAVEDKIRRWAERGYR
jgi:hypothetical protein